MSRFFRFFAACVLCVSVYVTPMDFAVAEASSDLESELFAPYALRSNVDGFEHELSALERDEKEMYHQIFALQENAQWQKADVLIARLKNPILMGHVRFQRLMHPTGYRSKFAELADWLDAYADLPDAKRIYRLARKRRPSGNGRKLVVPRNVAKITTLADAEAVSVVQTGKTELRSPSLRRIRWIVKENIAQGRVTAMLQRLRKNEWRNALTKQEYVQILGDIAKGYVIFDVDKKAVAVADEALSLDANYPSQAFWWAGLAAWRLQDYDTAAEFFTFLGNHPKAAPDIASAASFWAWRVAMRQGNVTRAHQALIQASQDGYSFYGQLARHALSMPDGFDWHLQDSAVQARKLIAVNPVLQRILALAEVGEYGLAQAEFARVQYAETMQNLATVMFVADQAGLANAVMSIGRKQARFKGERHDISRYPLPRWNFHDSYSIDRALLYALIHKESAFTAQAKSHAGAQGLMQIMPGTAKMMQKRLEISTHGRFYEPKLNLTLGQEYLQFLLTLPEINYNLIYTLAGYNAGPGRLRDWRQKLQLEHDPLLFIETIPVRETRRYIEIVLSNLWIYRKRLGQDTPSLVRILEGQWPLYQRLDRLADGSDGS